MSAQSIVTKQVLSNDETINSIVAEYSMDLLKYLRFDFGDVCHNKVREILRVKRLFCNDYCKLDSEEQRSMREALIRKHILKIASIWVVKIK